MPRAYSEDLRARLIVLVESGMPVRQVAKLLGISGSAASNWMRQWRKDRRIAPSPIRGHRSTSLAKHTEWLLALVNENKDLTLEQIRAELRTIGANVSVWTIWNFCRQHGVRLKRAQRRVYTQAKNSDKVR